MFVFAMCCRGEVHVLVSPFNSSLQLFQSCYCGGEIFAVQLSPPDKQMLERPQAAVKELTERDDHMTSVRNLQQA